MTYLESYAHRFGIRPEFGVEVTGIVRGPGLAGAHVGGGPPGRLCRAGDGDEPDPHVPDWPGRETFPGPFSHSVAYREPSPYRGLRVLVVGAGNSATEIADELTRVAAEVRLSVRTPPNIVRRDTLGVPSQLIGVALRGAARGGDQPALGPAPPSDGPRPDGVRPARTARDGIHPIPALQDRADPGPRVRGLGPRAPDRRGPGGRGDRRPGRSAGRRHGAPARRVIAATGYRPGLDRLVGDLSVLDPSGFPLAHGARTVPGAPDLYFVGLTVELSGLLREIGREAKQVARRIGEGS